MNIESNNVFYFTNINAIGGVETFFYNLARNYEDLDITVIYKTGDIKQINRLKKYVRVKQFRNQHIKCKKVFFNYITDIIDNVEAEEYIQIIHTVYTEENKPLICPKITRYIGVSQVVCDAFKKVTGKDCELCYNPMFIEKPKRLLKLCSFTRLTLEKGKDRMIEFARLLDEAEIPYLWHIYTDDTLPIDNPNIVYRQPTLNVTPYMADADYVVQLSNPIEGYGFTPGESLSIGTPVIVTDVPAYREIGVNETNGFILNCDMTNVPIKEIYEKAGKFNFKYEPPKDNWLKLLAPGKSTYQEEKTWKAKVKCIRRCGYDDMLLLRHIVFNEEYEIPYDRAEYLEGTQDIEILEIIKKSN